MARPRRARRSSRKLRQHGSKAQGCFSLERLEDRQLLTATGYEQLNLVSDQSGVALLTDPNLVNPYGIALASGSGDFWLANAGSNTLTRYNGGVGGSAFAQNPLTISSLPSGVSGPTGIVSNSTSDFVVVQGSGQGPAPFIFASRNGQLSVVPTLSTNTATAANNGAASSFYTGLALVTNNSINNLYAANFAAGTIVKFGTDFQVTVNNVFQDSSLTSAGYAPYNIQELSVNGTPLVFVTYAKQDTTNPQNIAAGSHGAIDVFGTDGTLKAQLVGTTDAHLSAPWGLAIAPANFGDLSNDLLVANGDGTIQAYSLTLSATPAASYVGALDNSAGSPIQIPGLHGLAFCNAASAGDANKLYFSGGGSNGTHGLFGELASAASPISIQGTNFTATEGAAISGVVASFTPQAGLAGDTFSATINWGDGTTSSGVVAANGSGGFLVSGAHTYAIDGNVSPVTVNVVDSTTSGNSASATVAALVVEGDLTATPAPVSATEGTAFSNVPVATFTDPATNATAGGFTANINWGDGTSATSGSVTGSNGTFTVSGSHTYATQGPVSGLIVTISEGAATPTPITVTGSATVADADTLSATASPVSTTEGMTFAGQVATFSDSFTQTPASAFTATVDWGDGTTTTGSITGSAGSFTVSGSHVFAEEGTPTVKVSIVENGAGATASATTSTAATIADGDTFTPTAVTIDATAGAAFSGVVAKFTDSLTTTPAGNLSATINWGDGSTTDAGTIGGASGTFTVSGSHTYTSFGGPHSVSVVLHENSPGSSSATASSTAFALDPNLSGTPATISATEGVAIATGTTVATFTDSNSNATAGNFTATIDWGDGTSSAAGSVSGGSGTFTVSGGHTYAHSGNFPVNVTIFETATPTAVAAVVGSTAAVSGGPIQVTAAPIAATEGSSGAFTSLQVASFTTADTALLSSDFMATIDWGDGTTSAGVVTGGNGAFVVKGGHTYLEEAPGASALTMKVTVAESAALGTTASATASATVAEGDSFAAGSTTAGLSTQEGATFSGPVATFIDGNTLAGASGFTAVINWGDGTTQAGTVSGTNGTLTVSGSHTYANDGNFTLVVNLVDKAPGTAEPVASGTAAVGEDSGFSATAVAVSGTEGQTLSGVTVATFTDAGSTQPSSNYVATIDWGDGTSATTGTVTGSNGTFTVSGTHAYADEGPFHPIVKISENNSPATISATGTATMSDADVLTGTGIPISPTVGATFTGTVATFTDAYLGATADHFMTTIDWGDGTSTSSGTVTGSNGTFTIQGSHVYASAAQHTVRVVINDKDSTSGASATSTASPLGSTLAATGVSVNVPSGVTVSNAVVATFTDSGPSQPASSYTATIDWGDGTTSTGTVTLSGSTFTVTGSHVYNEPKLWNLSIVVTPSAGVAATASATASVGGNTERLVAQIYHDLLARRGEMQGIEYWTGLINGGQAASVEVLNILHTQEYRMLTIQGLYQLYLHRAADPASLDFFNNSLINGATPEQIAESLASSAEYFQNRGAGTGAGFLNALYEDVVYQPPDAATATAWEAKNLNDPSVRAQAAAAVFGSDTYLNQLVSFSQPHASNTFASQTPYGFYEDYLRRDADSTALGHYHDMLKSGQHDDVVIAQIIGSSEYDSRV